METIRGLENCHFPSRTGVTVGNFDGFHLGHQDLVKELVVRARTRNLASVVMTFDPHPSQVLRPDLDLKKLATLEDLQVELESLQVDYLVIVPFDREFSQISAEAFFLDTLVAKMGMQLLVVGYDFGFGANKSGGSAEIQKMCEGNHIEFHQPDPVLVNEIPISSRRIRGALSMGDMESTRMFLGRDYVLRGVVEKGDGRGNKIGFPTANILPLTQLIPCAGVYFTESEIGGEIYQSLTNVGYRPTFSGDQRLSVETFILNFNKDIYNVMIKLRFKKRLRDEIKFSGVEALVAQIRKDIAAVKAKVETK